MNGIDMSLVSQTVGDAIKLAIGIGIHHLWVDAFCIIQDSLDDQAREIAKMAEIYMGAICTFSVASAQSSSDGFLSGRRSRERMIMKTGHGSGARELLEFCPDDEVDFMQELLHLRAWALQETILSPVLVSFLSDDRAVQIRCSTDVSTAEGASVLRIPRLLQYGPSLALRGDGVSNMENEQIHWYDIIMDYSKRRMTHKKDKLSALAAIASTFEERGQLGSYVAGIFTRSLRWDLLWSSNRGFFCNEDMPARRGEATWIAPTWSWASRDHPVYYNTMNYYSRCFLTEDEVQVLDLNVVPISPLVPNGALASASLTIRCYTWKEQWTGVGSVTDSRVLDDQPPTLKHGEWVWFLHLADEEPYNSPHSLGLIVQEVQPSTKDNTPIIVKRIGIYGDGPQSYFSEKTHDRRIFTII
jgi:Heterokaryon incompatibility protein (HET)